MKKCPDCHIDIPFSRIRANFKCPFCGIEIKSNWNLILGLGLVIWFFIVGPAVALLLSEHLLLWIFVDLILGITILNFMFLLLLKFNIQK